MLFASILDVLLRNLMTGHELVTAQHTKCHEAFGMHITDVFQILKTSMSQQTFEIRVPARRKGIETTATSHIPVLHNADSRVYAHLFFFGTNHFFS